MNAVALSILLHYYFNIDNYSDILSESEENGIKFLAKNNLIEIAQGTEKYIISKRGAVHIKALLEAPLPTQQWISPLSEKVN